MRFGLREVLFFLVLLGLPVAAYVFVFQPINNEIETVRKENSVKQAKLERLEVTQHLENLNGEIGKLGEAIKLFEAKLPAEKEVEVILREVWRMASNRGLRPRSVRTQDPEQSSLYGELPIKMEILGDFDGFYAFLLDLEQLSRITRISDMQMTRLKDEQGHMKAEFTLSIFFEPQQNASSKS